MFFSWRYSQVGKCYGKGTLPSYNTGLATEHEPQLYHAREYYWGIGYVLYSIASDNSLQTVQTLLKPVLKKVTKREKSALVG